MRLDFPTAEQAETDTLSATARQRMERAEGRPLFLADWVRAVFIHYEVEPEILQKSVPFELDLRDGHAYVSLVAFTMRRMRFAFTPRVSGWLLRPISNHEFLNIRTYVKVADEAGIYFLAEWLSNRLSVPFGAPVFGLPYRFGRLNYWHEREQISGEVTAIGGSETLSYRAEIDPHAVFCPCATGSLDEFLMERYTAFTAWHGRMRFFRVWHEPWPQIPLPRISVRESTLLAAAGECFADAEVIGANFSTGVHDVWMGWPHRLEFKKS